MQTQIKKKSVTMTFRIDSDLKKQAEALCGEMGLTMSAAYSIFLKALVQKRAIPFKVEAGDSFYSKNNMKHLKSAVNRLNGGNGKEHNLVGVDDD